MAGRSSFASNIELCVWREVTFNNALGMSMLNNVRRCMLMLHNVLQANQSVQK
jgi:hypothetical protein